VRKAGTRLRITAQLMTVTDGYQLWSERYDRELVDVFAVQDEIASAIAERLQLTFARTASAPRATTADVEAYELVTRGRALTAQRGRAILEALVCFERAIELTPNSAAAHAGLGNALRVKAQYGFAAAAECLPLAQASLERALEIEPENAEAVGHLAAVLLNAGVTGERIYELWERALVLDPRLSEVRALYGAWGLAILRDGREDARAEAELRRASADDPRNPIIWAIVAMAKAVMGHHEEAVAAAKHGCEIAPAAFAPHYALTWTQTWARHTEDGIATVEATIEQFGRHPFLLHSLTGLYMQRGDRLRAAAVHAELEARAVTSRIPFYSRAMSAMYLGRVDDAIDYAIRSAEVRDAVGPIWGRWPDLEVLRAHQRYGEVVWRPHS
jgi:serine/threonine-protein kinase